MVLYLEVKLCFKASLLIVLSNFLRRLMLCSILLDLLKLSSINSWSYVSNWEIEILNETYYLSKLLFVRSNKSVFLFCLKLSLIVLNLLIITSIFYRLSLARASNCWMFEKTSISFCNLLTNWSNLLKIWV